MSLMTGVASVDCFTWQLLFGVHENIKRRELSNNTALDALSSFCVTDKSRLQIEAELEAHLLPLRRTRSQSKRVKDLNGICAETCIRTAKLISLSLRMIVDLYEALIANPDRFPSAKHLQGILVYVSYAIRIWAETVDGKEYRGLWKPELKRNDRRLARAAHMQYCGQILLTVCRMTWPEDQHEASFSLCVLSRFSWWIEEQQIIFDKEAEDFSEAFIFDGSLTYKYLLEVRKTVLDSGIPRKHFVILQKLDRLRHDGEKEKVKWYQPDPALPLFQTFFEQANKKRKKPRNGRVKGSSSNGQKVPRLAIWSVG
ncbi:hypothetical protein MCOR25_001063 [Pyricularia grisea]|nr:hypothetical protein MCOR25_001063 [Pyricularia grisea]